MAAGGQLGAGLAEVGVTPNARKQGRKWLNRGWNMGWNAAKSFSINRLQVNRTSIIGHNDRISGWGGEVVASRARGGSWWSRGQSVSLFRWIELDWVFGVPALSA